MIKHSDSHVDHNLSDYVVAYVLAMFCERKQFFKETIRLPVGLGLGVVPCALFGPIMGDPKVKDDEASMMKRGTRTYDSRVIDRRSRYTSEVSVIAGPHTGKCDRCKGSGTIHETSLDMAYYTPPHDCPECSGTGTRAYDCVLYTAFGGPITPMEPGDPSCKDIEESKEFWSTHALSVLSQ